MLNRDDDRVAHTVKGLQRQYGWSRSHIYRRLASGDFRAVKDGSKTLILADSVRTYVASLPPAEFTAKPI